MIHKKLTFSNMRQPLIFYPWLIVILFILRKFDLFELHPAWKDIMIFLIMNFAVLVLLFIILDFFIRDRIKTWLVASILLMFLLYYSVFFNILYRLPLLNKAFNPFTVLPQFLVYFSLFIIIIFISTKYKGSLVRISKYLNVLLIVLILYMIFEIFSQNTRKITLTNNLVIPDKVIVTNNKPPDVYYIILDAYTSNQSLEENWGYNNDEITNFLKQEGFYIASDSRTNYNITEYSLCSSLNMSYLANVPKTRTEDLAAISNLQKLLENSQVAKFFLKSGYQITNYSFFNLPEAPRFYNDFYFVKRGLKNGTAFEGVLNFMNINWDNDNFHDNLISLKKINPEILNKLTTREANREKPNFFYAHIMMPHDPYLFDEFGRIHENDSVFMSPLKDKYLGQLKYANKLVIGTIESILNNYNPLAPPVIIVQGDHGYRYLSGTNRLKESMTIFNAYYFPDKDYSKISKSISPVNTFRVLFNKFMNLNLPIMIDTSYNVFY